MKKFNKLALFSAIAGAAAGTYYLLQHRIKHSDDVMDDLEDFDDIDEDLEKEDFSSDASSSTSNRNHSPYVSIDLENAKEKIGEKVIETLDKTKEKIEQFNVSEKIDRAKEIVSEMTTPVSEPVYTQMDMSSTPASDAEHQEDLEITEKDEPADVMSDKVPSEHTEASVSVTYAEPDKAEASTESFFDDTRKETTES